MSHDDFPDGRARIDQVPTVNEDDLCAPPSGASDKYHLNGCMKAPTQDVGFTCDQCVGRQYWLCCDHCAVAVVMWLEEFCANYTNCTINSIPLSSYYELAEQQTPTDE